MSLLTNIVSYWKLDGNSTDSLGINNGTDTSITYNAGNGIIIQGAGFTKAGSSLIATAFQFTTGTNAKSFSIWIKPTASLLRGWAIGGGVDSANNAFGLFLGTDGTGDLVFFGNGGANDLSITTISGGVWSHVVVTYDGTTLTAYVNGSSAASALRTLATSAGNTNIGRRTDNTASWDGAIDEVGVWSRALTAGEVTQLYNGGVGLQYPFSSNNSGFLMFM